MTELHTLVARQPLCLLVPQLAAPKTLPPRPISCTSCQDGASVAGSRSCTRGAGSQQGTALFARVWESGGHRTAGSTGTRWGGRFGTLATHCGDAAKAGESSARALLRALLLGEAKQGVFSRVYTRCWAVVRVCVGRPPQMSSKGSLGACACSAPPANAESALLQLLFGERPARAPGRVKSSRPEHDRASLRE